MKVTEVNEKMETTLDETPSLQSVERNSENRGIKKLSSDSNLPHYVKLILLKDVRGRERRYRVPASLDLDRPKRARTTFSQEQIQVLEKEFASRHFLSLGRRQALALLLGLSETQVKVWFQNRRTKVRKLGDEKKGANEDYFLPRFCCSEKEKSQDEEKVFHSALFPFIYYH